MRPAILAVEGRRARVWMSVAGAALGMVVAFALPSLAEIASIEPSSGRAQRGESTSAVVSVEGDNLTCVSATSCHPTTVTLDVGTACEVGDRSVAMDIRTSELTPVGEHTVTITEINALHQCHGMVVVAAGGGAAHGAGYLQAQYHARIRRELTELEKAYAKLQKRRLPRREKTNPTDPEAA